MGFGNTCTTDIYNQLYISNIDKIQWSTNTVNHIWLKLKHNDSYNEHAHMEVIWFDFACIGQYNIGLLYVFNQLPAMDTQHNHLRANVLPV